MVVPARIVAVVAVKRPRAENLANGARVRVAKLHRQALLVGIIGLLATSRNIIGTVAPKAAVLLLLLLRAVRVLDGAVLDGARTSDIGAVADRSLVRRAQSLVKRAGDRIGTCLSAIPSNLKRRQISS